MNGILNVYKEKGFTSHNVVAKLRGICHMKKIGHSGTLDPDAEGVLPVCLGKATKVCSLLTNQEKTYRAVLLLGQTTDTQDTSGQILKCSAPETDILKIKRTIGSFVGDYAQVPPMYSALKHNGKKLYELARAGIEVERKPRQVQIFEIQIEKIELPRIWMSVRCSKGTYIRTLCHDIGEALGCGGCMDSLLRTQVGVFQLESAYKLQEIQEFVDGSRLEEIIMPVDGLFLQYPSYYVKNKYEKSLKNGNRLCMESLVIKELDIKELESKTQLPPETIRIYDSGGGFWGIYTYDAGKRDYKPLKLFGQG